MNETFSLVVDSLGQFEKIKSVMFVSPSRGEGNTTAAVATAEALNKHFANKVVLVDANIRDPRLHQICGVPHSPGLSEVLQGQDIRLDEVIHSGNDFIDVVPCGNGRGNPVKDLASPVFQEFLETLKGMYDYVLVDVAPANEFPALNRMVPLFDGAVMVVACESTRWEVAQSVKAKLEAASANIIGVVMNRRKFYIPKWLYRFV